MAWTTPRWESSLLSGHDHGKPKVQRNLPVRGENVDDLLELLSMNSNDKNHLPGALNDVVLASTSAYSQPEPFLNLNTQLTATKSIWCGDHEMSDCFTDEDICGHRNRRTRPDSGQHYAAALGGRIEVYQNKHSQCCDKHQEKAEKECAYRVPLPCLPVSLPSTYPGSDSYYPDSHITSDKHKREFTSETHCGNDACLKQIEHVSTFQDIVQSSWISASLHRSMLDIEIGLSFGDLQSQGQTSSRNIALSATVTPLDKESHDSCHSTCKQGFSTDSPYILNGDHLTQCHFQRGSIMNATPEFTKFCTPGEPVSTKHCESAWKTPLEINGANLYSCKEWPLHESLSSQQKEVAFPDNVTRWPKEASSPSDSGLSQYAKHYPTRGTETSFKLPNVRRHFETTQNLFCEKRLVAEVHLDKTASVGTNKSQSKCKYQNKQDGGHPGVESGSQRQISVSVFESQYYPIHEERSETFPIYTVRGSTSTEYRVERCGAGRKSLSVMPQPMSMQPDTTEIHHCNPAGTTERRFLELYTFRLQQSCFRFWLLQWRSSTQARHHHNKHLLTTSMAALRQLLLTHRAQTDTLARRKEALTLAKAFHQWKRHLDERRCADMDVQDEAELKRLRGRLAPPSETLVLRTTYGAWRSRFHDLQLLRAALIHYHLALLYKHWLLWRRAGQRGQALVLLGQRAEELWEGRLKRQAYAAWSSTCTTAQQARQHHRRSCLAAAWRVWQAQAAQRENVWLVLTNQSAGIHRASLLRRSIQLWREKAEQRRRQKERLREISKRAALLWRLYTHRSQLQHLCVEADHVLSRNTLAVAFEKWLQRKAVVEATHRQLQRGRHLLERMRLRTAFTRWRHTACAWRAARALLDTRTQTQLSEILKGWRGVAQRKAVCLSCCRGRDSLISTRALRTWARARELRVLLTHLLTHLLESRRTAGQQTQTVSVGTAPAPLSSHPWLSSSAGRLERVCDTLKLQMSFNTWRKQGRNATRARLYCSGLQQKQARLVVQCWHGVAEEVLESKVLRFRIRLAALDSTCSPSLTCLESRTGSMPQVDQNFSSGLSNWSVLASPPLDTHSMSLHSDVAEDIQYVNLYQHYSDHRNTDSTKGHQLKGALVRAAVRMLHPLLSMAFSQWRDHVCASRARRQLTGQLAITSRWTSLAFTFNLWRRQTQRWQQAEKHREAVLLTSCWSQWKGLSVRQRAEAQMGRRAERFHSAAVLRRCFSAWHRQLRRVRVGPGAESGALEASRTAWLQRRGERRKTHSAFTLWRARFKQVQAVTAFYTSSKLTRVFAAWQNYGQHHRSMTALAQAQLRQRLLGSALARWRGWSSRLQEARRRAEERLAVLTRESLQRWREHTCRRRGLRLLLCQYVEDNRRRLIEETFLIWVQESHKVKRAQDLHQHNLTTRVIQRWSVYSQRRIKEQNSIFTMKVQLQHRAMKWAFTSWRGRVLHRQGVARTVAHHWRFRARDSRAASHYLIKLELRFFYMWKVALLWRRERRQQALELGRKWAVRARQRAADQERAVAFYEGIERRELAQQFWYWVTLHRSWRRSQDFHQQMLCQRAILSWHAHVELVRACRHCGANLQQRREQRLLLQCLTRWKSELGQAQLREEVLENFLCRKNRRVTKDTVNYWRIATRGRTTLRKFNNGIQQQCIDHWRTRTRISSAVRMMCLQRTQKDTHTVLLAWRQWTRVSTGQRQMGEAVGLWLEGHRVSRAFQIWVRVHQNHVDASRLSSAHLICRVFQGWREAVKESMFTLRSIENKAHASQIQSVFSMWRRRAASHKASQALAQRVTDRRRRSLLMSSLHAWHQEVQSCRRRSLLLSERYYACWVERATTRRNQRRCLLECRLRECTRSWRLESVLRRVQRRHVQDLWDNWRDQTAAALLLRALYTDRLQQGAWLTWRKRCIRTRVSKDLAMRFNRSLTAQGCQTPVLKSHCPEGVGCFPAPAHLILIKGTLSSSVEVFHAWRKHALCPATKD